MIMPQVDTVNGIAALLFHRGSWFRSWKQNSSDIPTSWYCPRDLLHLSSEALGLTSPKIAVVTNTAIVCFCFQQNVALLTSKVEVIYPKYHLRL